MSEELNKYSCGISVELLSAYIDNELDEQKYTMVKEHLKACVHCRKIVEQFREMDARIREMELDEPSPEFIFNLKKNVMERVGKKKRNVFWRFFPMLVPAAVAVLILVIIRNEGLENPVGMNNRVPYVYSEEKKGIEEEEVDISLPVTKSVVRARTKTEPRRDKMASPPMPTTIARKEEEIEAQPYAERSSLPEVGESDVIRAIVDSTGKIVNVAKGKSLVPEEDTTISRLLKGKQISPPTVQGKPTQMFVEFSPAEKDSN
uniref:Putative zinc-finger domain-containing protein n=1 Tax=candidate division WOR-3 bacterium TaxID=2052148 RepID=A0A7V0Z731_UNCW3